MRKSNNYKKNNLEAKRTVKFPSYSLQKTKIARTNNNNLY